MCFALGGLPVWAHSQLETNEVVRSALRKVWAASPSDNECSTDLRNRVLPLPPNTWQTFFGGETNDGWTVEGRRAAFDWYLETMCTNDCQALEGVDWALFQVALDQCRVLSYTNAVGSLKALVRNPRGTDKDFAIKQVIALSPIDDSLTLFIENVFTNRITYALADRGVAGGMFADKVRLFQPATNEQRARKDRAVKMFYRHRLGDVAGVECMDDLFVSYFTGYEWSSNRLEFANSVLQHSACDEHDRDYFCPITNLLLHAAQPLQQLNINVEGGE